MLPQSLTNDSCPFQWNAANVTPISLTPAIGKLMNSLNTDKIKYLFETKTLTEGSARHQTQLFLCDEPASIFQGCNQILCPAISRRYHIP